MSAGNNHTKLTATTAERVRLLEVLAKETRATPDQYDRNWRLALGTLGGGNHFIELADNGCADETRLRLRPLVCNEVWSDAKAQRKQAHGTLTFFPRNDLAGHKRYLLW